MRSTKMLGLAMVAVVAIGAFAGSANATRLHPLVGLCKAQELFLCAEANQAKLEGTLLLLQIGTGKLEGTINQSCTGGEIEGETGEMTEGPAEESKLLDKIIRLTFTGCEPCKKITTTASEKKPFTANLVMTSEEGGWTLEGAGNATFDECTFGVKCKFAVEKLEPAPFVEMNATEAIVNTNKAVLKRTEGSELLCGASGKWNAKYKVELKLPNGTVQKVWPTLLAEEIVTPPRLHPLVGLCKAQELVLCAEANQAKLEGSLIALQSGIGKLEGTINQKCTGGEIEGETGAMEGKAEPSQESKLLGKTTRLTFTGCEPCKKITTTPPFTTNIKMTSEAEGAAWTLEGGGSATFEECTFGVSCKFATEKLEPTPIVEMSATESWVNTNHAVLKRTEGNELFCGATGKWNAKYKLELRLWNGAVHNIWPTLLVGEIATPAGPHPLIGLCKAQELVLCAEANQAKLEGSLLALQIGTGELEGTISEKCTGGAIEGEAGEMTNGPGIEESRLLGKTSKLTFTGCEPCKQIVTTPPFVTNLKMTEELKSGEGKWTFEGAGNAIFKQCTFGGECKFEAAELKPEPFIEMTGTEAILNMNKTVLKRTEGNEVFCGNTGNWNAKYKLELKLPDGTMHNVWPTLLTVASCAKC